MINEFARNKNQNGFTLIELLIIIGIIGFLIGLAIPSYQYYINKTKFLEVQVAIRQYKIPAQIAYQIEGASISELDAGTNNIPEQTNESNSYQYIKTINMQQGIITVLYKVTEQQTNINYILEASEGTDGNLEWTVNTSSSCLTYNLCSTD